LKQEKRDERDRDHDQNRLNQALQHKSQHSLSQEMRLELCNKQARFGERETPTLKLFQPI
jgi:hypothetical protein